MRFGHLYKTKTACAIKIAQYKKNSLLSKLLFDICKSFYNPQSTHVAATVADSRWGAMQRVMLGLPLVLNLQTFKNYKEFNFFKVLSREKIPQKSKFEDFKLIFTKSLVFLKEFPGTSLHGPP